MLVNLILVYYNKMQLMNIARHMNITTMLNIIHYTRKLACKIFKPVKIKKKISKQEQILAISMQKITANSIFRFRKEINVNTIPSCDFLICFLCAGAYIGEISG